jgi:hypothetical protein
VFPGGVVVPAVAQASDEFVKAYESLLGEVPQGYLVVFLGGVLRTESARTMTSAIGAHVAWHAPALPTVARRASFTSRRTNKPQPSER